KPANILLVGNGTVKVSDYGIAQYFGSSRLTSANQVVGTIEYMAPEQARAGSLTPHTDMYSLGALMYVLLTGKPPYVARDLTQLMQKFRHGPPKSVRAFRPETPKVVEEVIFELLQVQTSKRPSDARIIGRRLEALLKTSPNCSDGNPFKNSRFSLNELEERTPSDSRIDLENPSETALREGEDFYGAADPPEDMPYLSVEDVKGDEDAAKEDGGTETGGSAAGSGVTSDYFEFDLQDQASKGGGVGALTPTAGSLKPREETASTSDEFALGVSPNVAATVSSEINADSGFDVNLPDSKSQAAESPLGGTTRTSGTAPFGLNPSKVGSPNASPGANCQMSRFDATTVCEDSSPKDPVKDPVSQEVKKENPDEAPIQEDSVSTVESAEASDGEKEERKEEGALSVLPKRPTEPIASPLAKFKPSEFFDVDESELGDPSKLEEEETEAPWIRWVRVAIMLAVFWGLMVFAVNLFKAPTADKLYGRIDANLRGVSPREFPNALRREQGNLEKFATLYPNDARAARARYFSSEVELSILEKNMQSEIQKPGGVTSEVPIERAYIEASRAALTDLNEGAEKLRAFIILFNQNNFDIKSIDPPPEEEQSKTPNSASTDAKKDRAVKDKNKNPWETWNGQNHAALTPNDKFVLLAKRQLAELQEEIKRHEQAEKEVLNDRLRYIESIEGKDPDRARLMRRAAFLLYGSKKWAQELLKEAPDGSTPNSPDESSSEPNMERSNGETAEPAPESLAPETEPAEPEAAAGESGPESAAAEPGAQEPEPASSTVESLDPKDEPVESESTPAAADAEPADSSPE
ncbi:MAG: protein kinase, partial [Thermoguttaceae bacterium]